MSTDHNTSVEHDHADTDWDHFDPSISAGAVRQEYANMREACPVVSSDRYGGFRFISRYDDVRTALNDAETYSSADGSFIPASGLPPIPALDFDEPEHSSWRAILERPLTPAAVKKFEPVIAEVVDTLIDQFAQNSSAELVHEFTEPLPAIVVGRVVGLDQEAAVEVREIAATLFASIGTEDFPTHMREFTDYTDAVLAERRANPRDDFMTELAKGELEGRNLDSQDVAGLLVAYLIGGHHSTSSGLAGLLSHILGTPELRDQVRDDSRLLMRVTEESLRLTTPLQLFARTVKCPASVQGIDLGPDERVYLNLAAANRDPREFSAPEDFDATRTRNRHLAFGAGSHVCVGQHLARAELRIAVERLLARLPDIRLAGEVKPTGLVGGILMGTETLPVAFTCER